MKLKNLMGAFLALAFAAVLPGAVRAEVEQGVIYSVDLVEGGKYGGRVPTEANPLVVNEKAVIRVRLVNANWQSPPATRVAVKDGWLYAASGERVWRRKTNPEETPQDTTAYLSKGEHRYTAHLPFFKAAAGKKSVLLPNFFYTEEGLKGQPPIPTGDAAAQAAANGDF